MPDIGGYGGAHGAVELPDQPCPGAALHRPRPGVRLRDIASTLSITERSAYGVVNDLARAGYVVKVKDGRRNRYEVQGHLPLPDPISRSGTVGEVMALLIGDSGAVAPVAPRRSPAGPSS